MEINSTFKTFFSFLYTTEASGHSEEMNQFLGRINFPRVDPLLVPEHDGPITLEEITKSINSLQSKKSPGPDGLPSEFYKKFIPPPPPVLDLALYNLKRLTEPISRRQNFLKYIPMFQMCVINVNFHHVTLVICLHFVPSCKTFGIPSVKYFLMS